MPQAMQLGALVEPGLRADAAQIYRTIYQEEVRAELSDVIWMEGTSDKFEEIYGFIESSLYFTHWPANAPIPSGTIGSQRFNVINRDFGIRQYLPRNYEDDQTGTAMQAARGIAANYAVIPTEVFYQFITAGTYDGALNILPVVPNSADGNALYISTTRYGSSSGNIVAVTSTSTVQGVITDIISVKRRELEFQNTEGRPFFNASTVNKLKIFHGTALTRVMQQAEFQTRVPWEVTSGANGTGQTPTNLLLQSRGLDIRYVNSQRITNSRYYVFIRDLPNYHRPIWRQVRKGYTEWQGNFVTSDHSRDTGQIYVQGDCREGYTSVLAISSCRVS